jgi:hypothetical protein
MNHRLLLVVLVVVLVCGGGVVGAAEQARPESDASCEVRDIGPRRELFVVGFLIERLTDATLEPHRPTFLP